MHRRGILRVAVLAAGVIAMGWTAPLQAGAADKDYRLTGPYTHDNLAIYLIHRRGGEDGPVPLTLGEAMGQGLVKVVETGDVEELVIRNLSNQEVFIQAGDIVKGGKAGSRVDRQHDRSPEFRRYPYRCLLRGRGTVVRAR